MPNKELTFLGRQPIIDRNEKLMGYELLFRSANTLCAIIDDHSKASARVVLRVLTEFGFRQVLGRHRGFFNIDAALLMSDIIELLPREQVVLELLEHIDLSDAVLERCQELKKKGFALALDDNIYAPEWAPLYELADIVKVDILEVPESELAAMVERFRKWPVILVAEKVETLEQFKLCHGLGFDLFQGYYFARPSVLKQRRIDPSRFALIKVMNLLFAEAELKEIETAIKESPPLTYSLLRLVNSVVIGLRCKIDTVRHGLTILGRKHVKRWVMLALFSGSEEIASVNPLLPLAATRGRLMEVLMAELPALPTGKEFPELAFITGILSLADVLLECPMEELVCALNLTDDIHRALISHEGRLGSLLQLVIMVERGDIGEAAPLLEHLGLSAEQLLNAQTDSFIWVNEIA